MRVVVASQALLPTHHKTVQLNAALGTKSIFLEVDLQTTVYHQPISVEELDLR